MVKYLQDIALTILVFTSRLELQLDIAWLPRHQNVRPDFFNKVTLLILTIILCISMCLGSLRRNVDSEKYPSPRWDLNPRPSVI